MNEIYLLFAVLVALSPAYAVVFLAFVALACIYGVFLVLELVLGVMSGIRAWRAAKKTALNSED